MGETAAESAVANDPTAESEASEVEEEGQTTTRYLPSLTETMTGGRRAGAVVDTAASTAEEETVAASTASLVAAAAMTRGRTLPPTLTSIRGGSLHSIPMTAGEWTTGEEGYTKKIDS